MIGSAIFYPMLAVSGMFVPLSSMPRPWALLGGVLPMSHAVALLRGAWVGMSWLTLLPHLGALALTIAICLALTTRVFRLRSSTGVRASRVAGSPTPPGSLPPRTLWSGSRTCS